MEATNCSVLAPARPHTHTHTHTHTRTHTHTHTHTHTYTLSNPTHFFCVSSYSAIMEARSLPLTGEPAFARACSWRSAFTMNTLPHWIRLTTAASRNCSPACTCVYAGACACVRIIQALRKIVLLLLSSGALSCIALSSAASQSPNIYAGQQKRASEQHCPARHNVALHMTRLQKMTQA